MLINADFKSLEIVVAGELSKDKVLAKELIEKQDIHLNNQNAFGLPSRLIAKVFGFRLLYGGSAYSYANDPDFQVVSTSQQFWQEVIDKYYAKYQGIARWHQELIREAQSTGKIEIFTGRYFPIEPDYRKREPWPLTIIKNYPVQSAGADLVMLARLEANKRLKASGLEYKLISTIHDSIVADAPEYCAKEVGTILYDSIEYVPTLCKQVFGYEFKLPLTSGVQIGPNKKDMVEIKFDK